MLSQIQGKWRNKETNKKCKMKDWTTYFFFFFKTKKKLVKRNSSEHQEGGMAC
jgi:hypothetical protein